MVLMIQGLRKNLLFEVSLLFEEVLSGLLGTFESQLFLIVKNLQELVILFELSLMKCQVPINVW